MAHGEGQSTLGHPGPAASKAAWRAYGRCLRAAWAADHLRRATDERAMQQALSAWGTWRRARIALIYLPFGDEPDPRPSGARGPELATTRTVGARAPLQLRMLSGPLERHPLGFWQPSVEAPVVAVERLDLVLVPGILFTADGSRLGYGQGHYDRLLPSLPSQLPKVGVTLEVLRLEKFPCEAHDVRMTHLLSPQGIEQVDAHERQ